MKNEISEHTPNDPKLSHPDTGRPANQKPL
jgi:hypothetical protein